MKSISYVLLIFIILVPSCYKNKPKLKIGVINLKKVMESSTWGRKKQHNINSEIAKRESAWEKTCAKPLKKIILEIAQLKKTNAPLLKQKKLKQKKLAEKCSVIKRNFQLDIENLNSELASQILKKVKNIAKMIAKQYKFDLIITKYRGIVLFNSSKIDITDLILKNLENE